VINLDADLPIQPVPAGRPCVWSVTNAATPCYLIGTIHALSGRGYPLPPPYYQALKESQQSFFEVAPDPTSEADFGKKFDSATTYAAGDEIRHHIHPKTWAFLEKNSGSRTISGTIFTSVSIVSKI
jgi:uncharacterized protein YbaP (TraB family)